MSETRIRKRRLIISDESVRDDADLLRALKRHFEIISSPLRDASQSGESQDLVIGPVATSERDMRPTSKSRSPQELAAAALTYVNRPICLMDCSGRVLWKNGAFDQLPATIINEVRDVCSAEGVTLGEHSDMRGWAGSGRKVEIQAEDDTFYDVILSPASDPDIPGDGKGTYVLAMLTDTSRERQLQRKLDAIDAAGSELVRLESDTVASLNTAERLALLEDNIIRYTRDLLQFDHFNIFLLEQATNRLIPVMMVGMPEEVAEYELYAAATGNGISGAVAYFARSCICPDVSKDPRYLKGLENAGSSLSVPLLLHDKVVGVFNVESGKLDAFTEDDRQFAEIFGRYVALALNILDLLVVERCATSGTVAVNVIGEINQPLNDIAAIAEDLREKSIENPDSTQSLDRIITLVGNVRTRVRDVAQGPRSILGAQEALASAERDPLLADCNVVVVDDEATIRNTIASILTKRGSRVKVFDSGQAAIDHMEATPSGEIGLVISDISMPDRNGYEVFAAARKHHGEVPVILMTGFGYDPHHSIVRASQEGLQCVLFKPFQMDRLLEEVTKAITGVASS